VPSDNFQVVSKCGDMDHDGVLDYAAGALAGPNGVAAYSGATGLPIHIWRDPTMAPFGSNLEGGEDLDQDGVNDLVALGNEYLRVLSGRDGTVLYMFRDSRWPGFSGLGAGIALMPPPPGERYPLLVYSESAWFDPATNPGTNNINPGLIWTYRGNPPGVRAYGQPDAAAGLPLPRSGMRDLPGPGVRLTLSDAAPGAAALLVYGVSDTSISGQALPMPLDPFGLPGLTLLCSSDAATFALAGTTGMASGYAAADLAMPPGRSLATTGTPLFAQWLWVDPGDASRHGSTAGQRFLVR
jgi:hypothetical protein